MVLVTHGQHNEFLHISTPSSQGPESSLGLVYPNCTAPPFSSPSSHVWYHINSRNYSASVQVILFYLIMVPEYKVMVLAIQKCQGTLGSASFKQKDRSLRIKKRQKRTPYWGCCIRLCWGHIPTNFITGHCHNCSISQLVITDTLISLVHILNFIIGILCRKPMLYV